jgi:hypothetical protein
VNTKSDQLCVYAFHTSVILLQILKGGLNVARRGGYRGYACVCARDQEGMHRLIVLQGYREVLCGQQVFLTQTHAYWPYANFFFQTHFFLLIRPHNGVESKPRLLELEPEPSLEPQTLCVHLPQTFNSTPPSSLRLQGYPLRRFICSLIPLISRSIMHYSWDFSLWHDSSMHLSHERYGKQEAIVNNMHVK